MMNAADDSADLMDLFGDVQEDQAEAPVGEEAPVPAILEGHDPSPPDATPWADWPRLDVGDQYEIRRVGDGGKQEASFYGDPAVAYDYVEAEVKRGWVVQVRFRGRLVDTYGPEDDGSEAPVR